jgi:hypothetical protein
MLARHGEYLYERTRGMLGSLSHLIRGAAIDAIYNGTEKITKAHLDGVRLDDAAESAPPRRGAVLTWCTGKQHRNFPPRPNGNANPRTPPRPSRGPGSTGSVGLPGQRGAPTSPPTSS